MLPLCFSITDNPLNTHTASHKRAITPESVRPFKAPRALPQPAETWMVLKDESYDLLTTKQRESKQTSSGFCFLVRLGCAYFSGSSFSAWFQLHVELLTHMSHILKNISFLCFSDATCAVRGVYIYYTYCGQAPTCTEAAGYKCSHVKYRLLQGQRSHATVTTCFFYQVGGAQLKAYLGEQ